MKTNNHIRGLMSAAVAMLLMALPCLGLSAQENNMSRNSVYLSTGGQPYGFGGKERQRLGKNYRHKYVIWKCQPKIISVSTYR
ncbi:MAG: hypothetical protein MJZ09_03415 [Bacteroidales bacterium]|nr:hypothetical protein [Bacteroidales bacterium]